MPPCNFLGVWLSIFFFAFETVAWKLFLSLRSLILKMWSLEFWCLSRADFWRLLQPVVVKGFLLPIDLQISQRCRFFLPTRQKRLLFLNGLSGLCFRIRHVFSTHCLCQSQKVPEYLTMKHYFPSVCKEFQSSFPIGTSKKQAWGPFKVRMALFRFKKGVRQRRRFKSLYFLFLKKIFLQIYAVLN